MNTIISLIIDLISVAISMVTSILMVIGLWKIFTKAGEEGWKAVIPYYNLYILCKIAGTKFVRLLVSLLLFIGGTFILIMIFVGALIFATAFDSTEVLIIIGIITLFFSIIMIIIGIWYFTERIILCNALSKSFGHGASFAGGLLLLAPIFYMILGFNKDQYIGPKGVKQQI